MIEETIEEEINNDNVILHTAMANDKLLNIQETINNAHISNDLKKMKFKTTIDSLLINDEDDDDDEEKTTESENGDSKLFLNDNKVLKKKSQNHRIKNNEISKDGLKSSSSSNAKKIKRKEPFQNIESQEHVISNQLASFDNNHQQIDNGKKNLSSTIAPETSQKVSHPKNQKGFQFRIYIPSPKDFYNYIAFLQKNKVTEFNFTLFRTNVNKDSGKLIVNIGEKDGMHILINYPVVIADDYVLKNNNDNTPIKYISGSIPLTSLFHQIGSLNNKNVDKISMVLTDKLEILLSNQIDNEIDHEEHALYVIKTIEPTKTSNVSMSENSAHVSKSLLKESLYNIFSSYSESEVGTYNLQFEVKNNTLEDGRRIESKILMSLIDDHQNIISTHTSVDRFYLKNNGEDEQIKAIPSISLVPAKLIYSIAKNLPNHQLIDIEFPIEKTPLLMKIKKKVFTIKKMDNNYPNIIEINSWMKIWVAAKILGGNDDENNDSSVIHSCESIHSEYLKMLPNYELDEEFEII